jgi:hypothetical protein
VSDTTEADSDKLLQATCEAIVQAVATAIDAEPQQNLQQIRMPEGAEVGRQINIDATEKGGLANRCRLSILNSEFAPAGEVVRIEFEHDKQSKYGVHEVYSVQSVRRRANGLVLLENFLAETREGVREEDFRPIMSEAYARKTVLREVEDWARYRAWQRQEAKKH